jgi:hypothetical protein
MKRVILIAIGTLLLASTVSGIIDTNNNGLSDLWERAYNDEQLFAETFDPEADADADGWTNAQEAAAGTDPCASSPPDGIVRPETAHIPAVYGGLDENGIPVLITPEVITVTWPTIAGKQYTLLFSPDLSEQSWLPIGAPFIGNGNDTIYNFEINTTTTCFWRVAVTDVDTDGDGLLDSEEHTLGSSRYLTDTDGDGLNDAAAHAAGKNPAGDGTDADGDGMPDNELYSVVFEIQQESLHMPYGVGFEDFYGTDNSHRYLAYKSSEEYSVSDSPRYTSVTDGSQVWTSTYLSGGAITADGQPVSQTDGTTFSDWKSAHQLALGEDEYIDDDPTETTVAGPTITATEIVTTTTDTTTWKVKRHVPGNPQGQLVRSGTETIVVTERFKLTDSVTYPEFWEEHVKARPWTVYDPDTYGPLNGVDYSRAVVGDVQTAENVREIFRNGNIDAFGRIADPGTSYSSDYGSDSRIKRVRWRWVRFNPLNPFDYEYATPPLSCRLNFHFLVLQNEYLNHREWQGSNTPITDETKAKGVIHVECVGDHGTSDWEEIPLATFNAHRIEDPVNLADIDFSKWGGTSIWLQSQVDLDWIDRRLKNWSKLSERI